MRVNNLLSLKSSNCWETLRAYKATAWPVMASANAKNLQDWAISSQAGWQQLEGSTTRQSRLTESKCPRMGTACEMQDLGYIGYMADRKFYLTKDELKAEYAKKSAYQIAKEQDVSKKTVLVWLRNYGIKARDKSKMTDAEKKTVISMIKSGHSSREISEKVGYSDTSIRRFAKRNGLKITNKFHVGFVTTHNGYKMVRKPNHPNCDSKGYVREHRLVAEQKIGRYLNADEIVHHIDHDKFNNDPENLEVMTLAEHTRLHHKGK